MKKIIVTLAALALLIPVIRKNILLTANTKAPAEERWSYSWISTRMPKT